MNKTLANHLLATQAGLQASYDIAKTHHHKGLKGTCREQFVHQFLSQHIPSLYEVLSGEIVDSDGRTSPQQDVIIHNPSIPKMTTSPLTSVVLAEGAVAAIEVKSQLKSKEEIVEVLMEVGQVKALKKEESSGFYRPTALENDGKAWEDNSVRSIVIAYESGSMELFKTTLGEFYAKSQPRECVDLIILLDRGVIGKSDGLLFEPDPAWSPPPPPTPFSAKEVENRLIYLYFYLFRVLTRYGANSFYELRSHLV